MRIFGSVGDLMPVPVDLFEDIRLSQRDGTALDEHQDRRRVGVLVTGEDIRLIVPVADLPPVLFFSGPAEVPDVINDLELDQLIGGQEDTRPDERPRHRLGGELDPEPVCVVVHRRSIAVRNH
jgi:hypothetical protein